jgi:hypothetical protein
MMLSVQILRRVMTLTIRICHYLTFLSTAFVLFDRWLSSESCLSNCCSPRPINCFRAQNFVDKEFAEAKNPAWRDNSDMYDQEQTCLGKGKLVRVMG